MARFCQKCGAEIPDGSPVCRSCFEPIPREGLLKRLLGFLSGGRVTVIRTSSPPATRVNINISEKITLRDSATGQMRDYHSLEEIPEEFREQIRKAREAAMTGQGGNAITVTDTDGKTQTYHSIDELPPDIRALYEKARAQDTSKDA